MNSLITPHFQELQLHLAELITTPLAFTNTTPSTMKVWARVLNTNGCFSVAELTLKVLLHKFKYIQKDVYGM
jgi:hypothetical protein